MAVSLFGAPVAQAQTITNTVALSFGAFVAGSGGSVVVDPNGARSQTGGVMLVSQGGIASSAQFSVTGTADTTYVITLPATAALSDGNTHSMALSDFSSSLGLTGTGKLSMGGTQNLSVGAKLTVGSAQPPGSYIGTFAVTVNYQ